MVHEQKFEDLLSSTCQVSVERRVAIGSILTVGNISSIFLFSHNIDDNANIAILLSQPLGDNECEANTEGLF